MKCKCKNDMKEIIHRRVTHYSIISVFWCKKCGRAAYIQEYDYRANSIYWYEPDTLPWHLKPRQPYKEKVEKEYGVCEYKDCDRKATWEVCATNGRAAMRCGRHKTGEGLTLDMRKIKKVIHESKR